MADFFSQRFHKNVWITNHARESMEKRNIDKSAIMEIINNGDIKQRDEIHLWVYKHIEGRTDNLICAAVIEQQAVIIVTVMTNWELEEDHED